MPNFSSLARLEVPEKFLWWVGWGLQSHFHVKPNRCVVLCWGWGFDNILNYVLLKEILFTDRHTKSLFASMNQSLTFEEKLT